MDPHHLRHRLEWIIVYAILLAVLIWAIVWIVIGDMNIAPGVGSISPRLWGAETCNAPS